MTTVTKPIERVLPLLRICKHYPRDYYSAICPAHHDSSPSLIVWEDATDDHVGLKCFSGCSRKAVVEAMGISEAALYVQLNPPSRPKSPGLSLIDLALDKLIHPNFLMSLGIEEINHKGTSALRIPYYLQDGKPYARARIRTARIAKEGSTWTAGQESLIPYGLERLEDARNAGYLVIVEGESDAWTLWMHHFPALGIPGAQAQNTLSLDYLAGINQVYIHEEPDEAGKRFATNIESRLKALGYAGSICKISVFKESGCKDPNDLHKYDVANFKATFQMMLDKAANNNRPALPGTLLSDVAPEAIHWLWKGRLALGKITMLDGDPGLGKSNVMLDIAARVSRGRPMPDGEPCIKGGVVLITPEDGLADTIQPRLARAGADLSQIVSIGAVSVKDQATGYVYNRPFTLPDDLMLLEAAIKRVQAKLVIIDPVMAILGSQNTYKDNEVRVLLTPVQMLLEEQKAAGVLVRHLNKSGGENALYRGGGSIAFIGLARLGLMIARDPIDDNKRVLATIKANISRMAPNLTYSITSDEEQGDERPYVVWEGVSTHSIHELIAPSTQKSSTGRQEILRLLKEEYPETLAPSIIAETLGITEENAIMTLSRMVKDGQIVKPARGLYAALSGL
ncbi:MAG TPA: AAA family ATPase [Ktedonobacteraceae bacterium]|nr:AAA family ATPase [Ktedonobacteraceae bacterium]